MKSYSRYSATCMNLTCAASVKCVNVFKSLQMIMNYGKNNVLISLDEEFIVLVGGIQGL